MSETSKKLDEYTAKCTSVEQVLIPGGSTHILRMRLKELVNRAITLDPLHLGTKSLELGWKKVFYEPIYVARRLKKGSGWSDSEAAYVEGHIFQGIGYFNDFIHQISHNCQKKSKTKSDELVKWYESAMRKCYVYLGDLSRYRLEFEEGEGEPPHVTVAKNYYGQALEISDEDGSPYNQLAALSNSQNYGLDSTYYYLRW